MIIAVVLVEVMAATIRNDDVDAPVALALLAIAAGMIGVPSGWMLVRRETEKSGPE